MTRTLTSSIIEEPVLTRSNLTDATGISEDIEPNPTNFNDDVTFFEELMTPPLSFNDYFSSFDVSRQVESSTNRLQRNPKRARAAPSTSELIEQTTVTSERDLLIPISGPNTEAVYEIVSKYINSPKQIRKVVESLESIPLNESVTANEIMKIVSSHSRPSANLRDQMIQELSDANLFYSTAHRKKYLLLTKGSRYNTLNSNN